MITMRVTGSFAPINLGRTVTRKIPNAMKAALKAAKNVFLEGITREYYVKRGEVNKSIQAKTSAATTKYHTSYIKFTGKRLSLEHYKLTPKNRPKKPKVLRAAVRRDAGVKPLGRAFLYAPSGGSFKPFARVGNPRLPIEKLVGPAIPQIAQWNEELHDEAIAAAEKIIKAELFRLWREGR